MLVAAKHKTTTKIRRDDDDEAREIDRFESSTYKAYFIEAKKKDIRSRISRRIVEKAIQMEQKRKTAEDDILELIPEDQLSPQQTAFRQYDSVTTLPVYKLRRTPTHFDKIDWKKYCNAAIWRENGTFIGISSDSAGSVFQEMYARFRMGKAGLDDTLKVFIYGKTDTAAIAETVTFLCSLNHTEECDARSLSIEFHTFGDKLVAEYAIVQPEQLVQILDANPTRPLTLRTGKWSVAHSVILATRPHSMNLTLSEERRGGGNFRLCDGGTAFVDALKSRISSFGSIGIVGRVFSPANLQRLLQLEIFDRITIDCMDNGHSLFSLSSKVKALSCKVSADCIQPTDFDFLAIWTKDLSFTVGLDYADYWGELLISFLNRVAELGHLERFVFSALWEYDPLEQVPSDDIKFVTDAVIRGIIGNPKLVYLDLSGIDWLMECAPQLKRIFVALEGHRRLRTFIVGEVEAEDGMYSWLERLLSHNCNITVLDSSGKRITNGSTIDELYLQNYIYNRSTKLAVESNSMRPLLLATALTESASVDFPETALLLSFNTDMLCEFIEGVDLNAVADAAGPVMEEAASLASSLSSRFHRRRTGSKRSRDQPSRAAKK